MNGSATAGVDTKSIKYFLLYTFGFTYPIVFIYYLNGFFLFGQHPLYANFPLAVTFFAPAIAAYVVSHYVVRGPRLDDGLDFVQPIRYLRMYLLIPALFIAVYAITLLLVAAPESWMVEIYDLGNPDSVVPYMEIPSFNFLFSVVFSSLTTAPLVSALHAFGQEYGFRAYLIPKLMPLGKKKAIVISSIVWALWYGPYMLIGMNYPSGVFLGMFQWMALTFFFGIFLGYLRITSKTVILPCFAHGVFAAQFYGLLPSLFPSMNKHIGGITGIPGLVVFGLLALWAITRKMDEPEEEKPSASETDQPEPSELGKIDKSELFSDK